uniref:GST N-terminal domain-containing protein n=1 Tax=Araucaria cunninghamii TaxID=56994 RepID=A0A0D6R3J7_ARACU
MAAMGLPAAPVSLALSSCVKGLRIVRFYSPRPFTSFCNSQFLGSQHVSISSATLSSRKPLTHKNRVIVRSMAETASAPLDICVKASVTSPGTPGDLTAKACSQGHIGGHPPRESNMGPFCQRVMLTLEEKHVPYNTRLVDLSNKPDWLFEISPEGKVPVIKLDDKWIPDSDVITRMLEEKYPNPSLETPPDKASVGSKIFPAFIKFLMTPTGDTEKVLLEELRALNEHLKANGPFINGTDVCAADLSLAPKLFHMETALGHFRSWSVPEEFTYVNNYTKALFSRESFAKTKPLKEDVIAGWSKKVNG